MRRVHTHDSVNCVSHPVLAKHSDDQQGGFESSYLGVVDTHASAH